MSKQKYHCGFHFGSFSSMPQLRRNCRHTLTPQRRLRAAESKIGLAALAVASSFMPPESGGAGTGEAFTPFTEKCLIGCYQVTKFSARGTASPLRLLHGPL